MGQGRQGSIPPSNLFHFHPVFTARKRSLRRLCFYMCLSVHRGSTCTPPGPGTPPRSGTPPGTSYTSPGPGTPPADQVHLPGQVHPTRTRYTPPGPGTPPDQVHPQTRYTPNQVPPDPIPPGPGTSPHTRYTPPEPGTLPLNQAHSPDQVHPPEQCMVGDMGNKRAVRILLEYILVGKEFAK